MKAKATSSDVKTINFFRLAIGALNSMIFLPPVLYHFGATKVASFLYSIMGFFCHQRADRSFYLFGEALNYPKEVVLSQVPFDQIMTLQFGNRFMCNDSLGCKFGVCARCTGIYMGLFSGLMLSKWIEKLKIPKIVPVLMLIPLILDGGIQTLAYIFSPEHGFYESNNIRRFVTGSLFGLSLGYFSVLTINSSSSAPNTTPLTANSTIAKEAKT